MIKIFNTREVAEKTGLSDRSVRRRVGNGLDAVVIRNVNGGRETYGVTENSLKTFKENLKTSVTK